MQNISKMRWISGFKDRTKALGETILPKLTAERNALEKAYFVYAFKTHLQEYDGGFIEADKEDYTKSVIDSRLGVLKPVLEKAIDAMKSAKIDEETIKVAQDFLSTIDEKPRKADNEKDDVFALQIPTAPVEGMKKGVDYFVEVVDRFMRHHIIHAKLLGDADAIPFDFTMDHDLLVENLAALNMRMIKDESTKILNQTLADIYYRCDPVVVDTVIKQMSSVNGLLNPIIQQAAASAKKAAVDDDDFEDDIVMDLTDLPKK